VLGGLGGWLLAGLLKPALLRPLHLSVRDARFLLSCLVLVPVTVALLKYQSGTSCVRELLRYGGIEPDAYGHLSLARLFDAAKPHGCWPSGHVSGGFALLALGFVGRTRRTRALLWLCGAAIGTAMGTYQVLRGAHFVSHVLATALVAQALVCLLSGLLMPQPRPESGSIHE
jgi:membrane-associated PAP2 superfamily phosphatase